MITVEENASNREPLGTAPAAIAMPRLHACIALLLAAVLIYVGFGAARPAMYSQFRDYDDEGYMMMTVRQMLDGHRLYDQVPTPYGPAYYLYKWTVHGLFKAPVSNDGTRLNALLLWVAAAALLGALAWKCCGSAFLALGLAGLCFLASLMRLEEAFISEPGHPHELVGLLVALGVLVAAHAAATHKRGWLLLSGLIGGTLLVVKINVGVLLLAATGTALVLDLPPGRLTRTLRWLAIAAITIAPALLLRRHLSAAWCLQFCTIATLGVIMCWTVALRTRPQSSHRSLGSLGWWIAGIALGTVPGVAFALLQGSTPSGMLQCLVLRAMRFPEAFCYPIPLSTGGLLYAIAGAALAGGYLLWPTRLSAGITATKMALAAAVLAECFDIRLLPATAGRHLEYLFPFLWLILVSPPGHQASMPELFLRRLLALVASLQVLQVYPVPGSQQILGTLLAPTIAVLWLADAIRHTGTLVPLLSRERWIVSYLALLAIAYGLHRTAGERRDANEHLTRLNLPGCRRVCMLEKQVIVYRWLADYVSAQKGSFLCNTGLNSLYFWSKTKPISPIVIGDAWEFLTASEQARLIEAMKKHPNMVYLHRRGKFPPKIEPAAVAFARREFGAIARIGPFSIGTKTRTPLPNCVRTAPAGEKPLHLGVKTAQGKEKQLLPFQVLQFSMPPKLAGKRVTAITVVDLVGNDIVAGTQRAVPGRMALLLDGKQNVLLSADRPGELEIPSNPEAWRLAIPQQIELHRYSVSAVRLYNGAKRIATLPVAVLQSGAGATTFDDDAGPQGGNER